MEENENWAHETQTHHQINPLRAVLHRQNKVDWILLRITSDSDSPWIILIIAHHHYIIPTLGNWKRTATWPTKPVPTIDCPLAATASCLVKQLPQLGQTTTSRNQPREKSSLLRTEKVEKINICGVNKLSVCVINCFTVLRAQRWPHLHLGKVAIFYDKHVRYFRPSLWQRIEILI